MSSHLVWRIGSEKSHQVSSCWILKSVRCQTNPSANHFKFTRIIQPVINFSMEASKKLCNVPDLSRDFFQEPHNLNMTSFIELSHRSFSEIDCVGNIISRIRHCSFSSNKRSCVVDGALCPTCGSQLLSTYSDHAITCVRDPMA